nr:GPO family capsid scaffolding protein [Zooshikella ganghwensis]
MATTDWLCIMKSGPTVDGREIAPQAVKEMAESYNPDEYTAMIWYEHFRFYGNFGQVVELKTEVDPKDRQCLFAKIKPNQRLYALNEQQQQLFFSGEILPDFRKTGKAYLFGLAITDQPASVGTSQLHFNHRRQDPDSYFSQPLQFSYDDIANPEKHWFSRMFSRDKSAPEQGNPMDDKQFTQLLESQNKNAEAITQLTAVMEKFSTAAAESDDKTAGESEPSTPPTTTETTPLVEPSSVSTEEFNSLKQSLTQLENIVKQFSMEGTYIPENEGPAEEHDEVL